MINKDFTFVHEISRGLIRLLERDGFTNITGPIGVER